MKKVDKNSGKFLPVEKEEINKIIMLYNNNISCRKIAQKLNYTTTGISNILKRNGIKLRKINNRIHNYNDNYFSLIDNEEKAYWLGFIMADGCVNVTRRKRVDSNFYTNKYSLVLSLKNEDKNHLVKFCKAINYDDLPKDDYCSDGFNKHKIVRLAINNKTIVFDLISLGVIPRKSLKEKEPKINYNLLKHFYRGYFDGDGCFYKAKKLNLKARSKSEMSKWLITLCGSKKIINSFNNYIGKKLNIYNKSSSRKNGLNSIVFSSKTAYIVANHLYENSNIYLDRKFYLYEKIKKDMEIQNANSIN